MGLKIAGGVLLLVACVCFVVAKSGWDEGIAMEKELEDSGVNVSDGLGEELLDASTAQQGGAKLAGAGGGLLLIIGATLLLVGVKKGSANS